MALTIALRASQSVAKKGTTEMTKTTSYYVRTLAMLVAAIAAALVLASGAALAVNKVCPSGTTLANPCSGTTANDLLIGTSGFDYIKGLAGNDKISAGAGDDTTEGGRRQRHLLLHERVGNRHPDRLWRGRRSSQLLSGGGRPIRCEG